MDAESRKIENDLPLVSIVVPAYNAEKYISQTLDSILAQTYENYEVLAVDDCSGDTTWAILQAYAARDSRLRLLKNEKNSGVSKTRNLAVEAARGEFIAYLDSDDIWEKNKLEQQVRLLRERPDSAIIYTGSAFIDCEGRRASYVMPVPETMSYKELLKQNRISCSSVLVRREYMLKYKMEGDNMHEDYAVWLRMLRDGAKAYGINQPLLIYRVSASSKSGNKFHAAGMTYKAYKFVGLGFFHRLYCMCFYVKRSISKYKHIKKSLKQ